MNEEEVKHRMFREHVKLVLERVGKSCERWPFYQNVRGRVVAQLNASEDSGLMLEEKESLLTDYEVAVTIISYYMGFQAGYRLSLIHILTGKSSVALRSTERRKNRRFSYSA